MRELARIQLRGDSTAFEKLWNARFTPKIEYGVVAIYKDDPAYSHLRTLFSDAARWADTSWSEHVEVEYTDHDLVTFDLLRLNVVGRAGAGGNEFAQVYLQELACRTCGRVRYRQVSDLVLDLLAQEEDHCETGYFQHDVCKTDFSEVIVSGKVKTFLESHGVPGLTFRSVSHVSPHVENLPHFYQLLVGEQIGPLVEPTRILRYNRCNACGYYEQVLFDALPGAKESEFYFSRSSYGGGAIMATSDEFGRGLRYHSEVIISQEVYRLFKENNITGFWVQPAHLV